MKFLPSRQPTRDLSPPPSGYPDKARRRSSDSDLCSQRGHPLSSTGWRQPALEDNVLAARLRISFKTVFVAARHHDANATRERRIRMISDPIESRFSGITEPESVLPFSVAGVAVTFHTRAVWSLPSLRKL